MLKYFNVIFGWILLRIFWNNFKMVVKVVEKICKKSIKKSKFKFFPTYFYQIFKKLFFSFFCTDWMSNPFDRVVCGDFSGKQATII
jgi:hypothetical protein